MTITNGYATLAEFKAWEKISSTDATDDTVIEQIIEAASRYIDGETGRTFYARSETHYFDVPFDSRLLLMDDDLLTIGTLTNGDGTVLTNTYYNLVPKNKTPYYGIRLKESSSYFWDLDGNGNSEAVISVAGTWGWSATAPHDIRQSCLMIAVNFYKRRMGENVSSITTITAAGVVLTPQDVPGVAAQVMRKYRKIL